MGIFDEVSKQVKKNIATNAKAEPDARQIAITELKTIEAHQSNIIKQVSDRASEGRPRLPILDDQLDELELRRAALESKISNDPKTQEDFEQRIRRLQNEVNPQSVELIINAAWYYMREHADNETKQPFVNIVRQFIQKVVVGSTPGHQPASLEVHGRIASILAAMETSTVLEQQFLSLKHQEYFAKVHSGNVSTEAQKQKLLDAYAEELSERRLAWSDMQVSVVAGAGFSYALCATLNLRKALLCLV